MFGIRSGSDTVTACLDFYDTEILSDQISLVCSELNILCGDNFSVLKGTSTQFPIFAVGSLIEDALEKNKELWLVLQDMQKAYNSVGWPYLLNCLKRIKMCPRFVEFFGSIHNNRFNSVMTDFGFTDGYTVYNELDQREVFLPLLWRIFYDSLFCEIKRHEQLLGYRVHSNFFTKTGRIDPKGGKTFFLTVGAFILDIASEFFSINNIFINMDKTVAILINQSVKNISLSISGSKISIAKKGESHRYLGIFLSNNGLSKPSLTKAHSNVKFFSNVVLRKVITEKQFLYLVSAVLQPIINYRLQFSYRLLKKGLKLKANLPKNFLNKALYYPGLYDLKTFEQVLAKNLMANLIKFFNSAGILSNLFEHRAMDLQAASWMPRHPLQYPINLSINSLNCFLVGATRILAFCNLFLGGVLPNVFQVEKSVMMIEVLGLNSYLSVIKSLKKYDIAFVNQLLDCCGVCFMWPTFRKWKKLDPRSPVPAWFTSLVSFIEGGGLLHNGVVGFQLLSSEHYCNCGSIGRCLLSSGLSFVKVYTDGSVKDFGLVNTYGGAAAYFPDVDLGIEVKVNGLLSLTLAKMQAIAFTLECIPDSSSVNLFTNSQTSLNICKFDSSVPVPDFHRNCWIKKEHIYQIISRKHLSVNWQKVKGHLADFFADTATTTSFLLPLRISYQFLTVEDRMVSGNAHYFVKSLFNTISFIGWEAKCIDSIVDTSIDGGLDMAKTLKIWHLDGNIHSGYTSTSSAVFCSYIMKALYCHLPVTKRKRLYNPDYPSVVCIRCGEVKDSNHIFLCALDIVSSGASAGDDVVVWFLCEAKFSSGLYITLAKSFVLKSWVVDVVGRLTTGLDGSTLVVNLVRDIVASHRFAIWLSSTKLKSFYEKNNFLPHDSVAISSVFGFLFLLTSVMIHRLGIRLGIHICFDLYVCLSKLGFGFLHGISLTTVDSVIAVIKKAIKVSGSEGGFKMVASRKKRKGGVLAESVDSSKSSEVGNTTESESIDMKEECLVEETSVNYGENSAFAEGNPDQMPKSLRVKTKKMLRKPLGVIDYGTVNIDDDVLDGSFLLPPPLPIKPSVQMPVRKSFALDIDLVGVAGKSSQEKLNFVRKIFSGVNGFGEASAPSKFGGIIRASFTSEKAMMTAAQLANDHGVMVNTNLKHPINNRTNWAIVLKKILVGTSIEAVHAAISEFGLIKSIKMQLVGLWQKVIIELEDQIQTDLLAAKWLVFIGKDAVRVARANAPPLMIFKTSLVQLVRKHVLLTAALSVMSEHIGSLIQTMANTPVIKGVGLHWSHLTAVLCSICRNSSHTSLACRTAGVSSSPRCKRAPLSAQDQLLLAKIYKKKSAPVFRPLAFVSFSGLAQSGSVSYGKSLPTVSSELEDCLKNIESSLVSLAGQIGELAKRLDSFMLAVSQPSPGCQLPMTPLSQNQGEDIVMGVDLDDATSDKTAAVIGSTVSPEVVKLENMLEGLSASAGEINSLIAKAVNEFSFVILGGNFNENGSHKYASFKKCSDLDLVNSLGGSFFVKTPTWCNSYGITKTIDYVFVSSNLVGAVVNRDVDGVEEYFDTDHKAVYVSVRLGGLLDVQLNSMCKQANKDRWKYDIKNASGVKWSEFRNAMAANAVMFLDEFVAAKQFSDLDAMWDIVHKVVVLSAGRTFKKKWFKSYDSVFNKISFRFHRLELLVSKLVRNSHLVSGENFASLLETWDKLDSSGSSEVKSLFLSGSGFDHIRSALAKARKLYCVSKLLESKRAEESSIKQAISKRMESFELNKSHTIKSVLECSFCKMVLDHLVVGDELVLEPESVKSRVDEIIEGWMRKCWYVFDGAFSGVMCSIEYDEFLGVVSDLPNSKAAGLSGISNELWKHCNRSVLDLLLVLLNSCLSSESWENVLTNTRLIALIKMARKILSKILFDRISLVCSTFDVLWGDNFLVLKDTTTQSPIFAVDSVVKDALEKNRELWLVLQNMQKVYDSVGWEHLEKNLVRVKMFMTDFGLTSGYHVHNGLDQREIFSPLLWHIFYDPLLCEVKRQESICGYRLNSHFVSKNGYFESQTGFSSFFITSAFVDDTIWVGSSQMATQHILNVASEFFRVNDISINNDKTVAISINSRGLSKPSLIKAHSDIRFFTNLVLRKAVSDKQFLYLVSAVLHPIVSYRTQFSFISVSMCNKWDALICKGLKLKSGLPLDFPNDAIYYPSFYGLNKVASLVSFANSDGILDHLFSYRSHDLQVLCWHSVHPLSSPVCICVSASNNFLAGMVRVFLDCSVSLGGSFVSSFQSHGGVPMSEVLDESKFLRFLPSLWWYGIAFVDQLCDHHGAVFSWYTFKWWKRLDPCGPVPKWFKLSVLFLNSVGSSHAQSLVLGDSGPLNILESGDFVSVCDRLLATSASSLLVYTDGFLSNLGTVGCRAGAVVFFEDIGLGLGVSVLGLMSSILAELQAIVLAMECVLSSSLVCLFSDSQSALDACRSELDLVYPNYRNQYWVEHCHIVNVIYSKKLRVSFHKVKSYSGVSGNKCANAIAGATSLSNWYFPLRLSEHFLSADGGIVSGNSRHFKVGSDSGVLVGSLSSEVDWPRSLLVWHPDLHMAAGFTSRSTFSVRSYFMKSLHYRLPVAVRKRLYNRHYPSVLCLYCGEVEVSNHVFSYKVDRFVRRQLLESHVGSWKAISGSSHSSSGILQLLSSSVSDSSVSMALFKGFVFNGWFCEAVSIFHDPKITVLETVKFVHSFGLAFKEDVWSVCAKHCAYMEKNRLILLDGSAVISVHGLASRFSAGVVRLLGVTNALDVYFGFRKSCLFFSGIGNSVLVHIAA
ncbi:hypothetical protein G9A89_020081 [Geosiphon pyriformis]|nr:hypothetical protein G9A89_020081 [Geosiphon pyriformis]